MTFFSLFLAWKKFQLASIKLAIGRKRLGRQHYTVSRDALPKSLPRIIWMYWDQPLEEAPEYVRLSVDTWRQHNPGWEVRVLSDRNLSTYVSLPEVKSERKIQWKADLIRLSLLAEYGGVWADATTYCRTPLDSWLPPLMQSGFFAFTDSYPGRAMSNWFLASTARNALVSAWAEQVRSVYASTLKLKDYYWVMHAFSYVTLTNRDARAIWTATPKLSDKGPILFKRLLTNPAVNVEVFYGVELAAIPLFKASSGPLQENPKAFLDLVHNGLSPDREAEAPNV